MSLSHTSLRCAQVIKEMCCPLGGCVPRRNRKQLGGCLPCLPAEVGGCGGRRCADTPPSRCSPGILAGWERRGKETQPKAKTPPSPLKKNNKPTLLQVGQYDGLAAERVVTFRSVQEETGSSGQCPARVTGREPEVSVNGWCCRGTEPFSAARLLRRL